jgi:hypothetical protein
MDFSSAFFHSSCKEMYFTKLEFITYSRSGRVYCIFTKLSIFFVISTYPSFFPQSISSDGVNGTVGLSKTGKFVESRPVI